MTQLSWEANLRMGRLGRYQQRALRFKGKPHPCGRAAWIEGKKASVDVTIGHPLAPSIPFLTVKDAVQAAAAAEEEKHIHNDAVSQVAYVSPYVSSNDLRSPRTRTLGIYVCLRELVVSRRRSG